MKPKLFHIFIVMSLIFCPHLEAGAQLLGAERNGDGSITLDFGGGNTITTTSNGSYTAGGTGFCSGCQNMLPPVTVYGTAGGNSNYNFTAINYNGQYYQIPPDPNASLPYYNYTFIGSAVFNTAPSTPLAPPNPPAPPTNPCKGGTIRADGTTPDPRDIADPPYAAKIAQLRNSVGAATIENAIGMGINTASGQLVSSPVIPGTREHVSFPDIASQTPGMLMAIIHTHPSYGYPTPSVDDFYLLIAENNNTYHSLTTGYIFAPNNVTYAYAITDVTAAYNFVMANPQATSVSSDAFWAPGTQMNTDYNTVFNKLNPNTTLQAAYDADALAQAYVLDKYNVGVTMSQMDANGKFQQIHVVLTIDASGNPVYTKFNCN